MLRVARCGITLVCLAIFANISRAADEQPIARDQFLQMIKAELGDSYRPGNDDAYLSADQAIENFFSATDTKERSATIATLQQGGMDVNILGKLARLRSDWPALAPASVTEFEDRRGPIRVHYFLGAPQKYDRTTAWPLVIRLTEVSAFAGNPKPSADDIRRMYINWIKQDLAHHPSALVLMPVLDLQTSWGPSFEGMNLVTGALQDAASRANIDPARVYLIGHGPSANAAFNLATLYPTYFAAINPLAGAALADWQRSRLTDLHNLLVVQWNDTDDKVARPEASRNIAEILHRLKIDDDYIATRNIGHDPTSGILEDCYEKLLSRRRELYPRQIELESNRPETQFNRIDWLQIYQPLDGGEEKRIFFKRIPGHLTLMSNDWSASALIDGNLIDITTDNVRLLRIYLNDQMVDLHEPVSVIVNKQTRLNGIVSTSVKEMLNDQLFIGRGWRYFSGVIDIDLSAKPATTQSAR